MNGNEIFLLERNNYFKGKQLNVRDFQDEQNYHINKRRIMNYSMLGSGVITGLDVVAVDNMHLTVESGMAVDGAGREIVLALPTIKALNVLEGFDEVDDKQKVYLCIEYMEKPVEPTHSITTQEAELYNRVWDDYRIFLTNRKPANLAPGFLSMLQTTKELCLVDGVSVQITVPRYVNQNGELEVRVEIEKCNIGVPLELSFTLSAGSLEAVDGGADGNHTVSYYNALDVYHKSVQTYRYRPVEDKYSGKLSVLPDTFRLTIDKTEFEIRPEAEFGVQIIQNSLQEQLISDFMHRDIDGMVNSQSIDPIYLAELQLMKTKNNGFIEKLEKLPFQQYVMSNGLMYLLEHVRKQDNGQRPAEPEVRTVPEAVSVKPEPELPRFEEPKEKKAEKRNASFGVENIIIEKDSRGKIYYSSEIIHNLGAGEVSYELGFELPLTGNGNMIVFGESDLFAKSPYAVDYPQVRYSIISYNDRGTFRIAIQLLDKLNAGNLKIHWYAVKHGGEFDRGLMAMDEISVAILPKVANIQPRDTIRFTCKVQGSDDNNCIWKVEDPQGGSIDSNGVYTAPSKPGVYEITATSVKYPTKKASNFVVVSSLKNA